MNDFPLFRRFVLINLVYVFAFVGQTYSQSGCYGEPLVWGNTAAWNPGREITVKIYDTPGAGETERNADYQRINDGIRMWNSVYGVTCGNVNFKVATQMNTSSHPSGEPDTNDTIWVIRVPNGSTANGAEIPVYFTGEGSARRLRAATMKIEH